MNITPLIIQHLNNGLPFPRFQSMQPIARKSFAFGVLGPIVNRNNIVYKHDQTTPEYHLATLEHTADTIKVTRSISRHHPTFNKSDPELLDKIKQHLTDILNMPHHKWNT